MLTLKDVRRHYAVRASLPWKKAPVIRAVDGVSFEIRPGETLGLVGESGCGKTTLGKLILRLEYPTQGQVAFEGQDLRELSDAALRAYRLSVQAVFQDPWSSLNPRMRVAAFVGEPLVVAGGLSRKDVSDRVRELLDSVGLDPRHGTSFPHVFSGGQRQRIAVARALASHPRLIVLDEPVSALDMSIRSQIMNLLRDLQDSLGVAYLLISHNLATVRYLAHRVAIMYMGEIVEIAPSEELFNSPGHPYTRALLAADLQPQLHGEREEIVLTGEVPSPVRPPAGCRFHTRCWLRDLLNAPERCVSEGPSLRAFGETRHLVACHFADTTPHEPILVHESHLS